MLYHLTNERKKTFELKTKQNQKQQQKRVATKLTTSMTTKLNNKIKKSVRMLNVNDAVRTYVMTC